MNQPIRVHDLSKRFKVYDHASDRLREWLTGHPRHQEHWALRNISFDVAVGEVFGVVGPNGSGKSTLLKILTGVLYPTSGEVSVQGRVVSLLELGTGFNPELSGRQNIITSARLIGLSEEFIRAKLPRIVEFAEVGPYIDHPIKFYSSGMLVRLAFAIFANVEPDVFIVDEALSVGDLYFQQKCFRRIDELRSRGCTMLFVSHDLDAVRRLCQRAMYLDAGECRVIAPAASAVDLYIAAMTEGGREKRITPRTASVPAAGAQAGGRPAEACARIGTADMTIQRVEILDEQDQPAASFVSGQTARIVVDAVAHADARGVSFGIMIYDRFGTVVFGIASDMIDGRRLEFTPGASVRYVLEVRLALQVGGYSVDADIGGHDERGRPVPLDRVSHCADFEISRQGERRFHGITPLECVARVEQRAARGPNVAHPRSAV
ncbi:MAG: Vitamin B12 import ATP-binding protein BtuD [Phycisphaerae bacterium]|nr:Vitamin B12 import ATP-binding protein BtuD [Phycisphaerae bacterium]